MTADLVARLCDADMGDDHSTQKLLVDAAAEIERLRKLCQAANELLYMYCPTKSPLDEEFPVTRG